MASQSTQTRLLIALVAAGVGLHGYTAVFEAADGVDAFVVWLFAWSCLPYLLCLWVGRRGRSPLPGIFGSGAALVVDSVFFYSVFVAPQSSTAAVGLLFAPLVNLILALPLGMLVGVFLSRVRR